MMEGQKAGGNLYQLYHFKKEKKKSTKEIFQTQKNKNTTFKPSFWKFSRH